MSDVPAVDTSTLESWFDANWIALLVVAAILLLLYAYSARIVRATVSRALAAQSRSVVPGSVEAAELQKRSDTLESLVTSILRLAVASAIVILLIGLLGLWPLLAGIGLVLAALTLAGQSIVLDYLMGVVIILEGSFFKGDSIAVGTIAGTVEEVGLRRTTVRSPDGTVHSISNGELRIVSNRTRLFAGAEVRIDGIRQEDLEQVIAIMDRVGAEIARDPQLGPAILEVPGFRFADDPDDLGLSATMRGKVVASERWAVSTELRRRLNQAFLAEGIELNKRGIPPRPPYRVGRAASTDAADAEAAAVAAAAAAATQDDAEAAAAAGAATQDDGEG
jgi:small-conductance mechanosensitive channel